MSIRISIYDFFAYTIPGGLYLFTVIYICTILGIIQIDWLSLDLPIAQMIVIAGLAYITGLIFDPIAKLWYRLFKPENFSDSVLKEFEQLHPSLKIKFRASDWTILLAQIRRESIDLATEIERSHASHIMLRNISLGLMLLSLVQVMLFVLRSLPVHLILGIIFVLSSVIAGKESVKFAKWFYLGIFESIVARSFRVSDIAQYGQESSQLERIDAPEP